MSLRGGALPPKQSPVKRKLSSINFFYYNTHGHKLRFPPSKKAQFVTECGINGRLLRQRTARNDMILLAYNQNIPVNREGL